MSARLYSHRINDVVIVAIDDNSIKQIGTWPWPRNEYALIIDSITKDGAKAIGMDIILERPASGDEEFAKALARSKRVVLAAYSKEHTGQLTAKGLLVGLVELPTNTLAHKAAALGHIALVEDSDGVVRRLPILITDSWRGFPAFGITVAALSEQVRENQMIMTKAGLRMKGIDIPLDEDGCMWIRYQGKPGRFPYVSAVDVISENVPPDIFKDKIVLIGMTATGLSDLWTTPFASMGAIPGVEVHANVIQAILHRDFLRPLYSWWIPLSVLLTGLASGILGEFVPAVTSYALSIIGGAGIWWLGAGILIFMGFILQIGPVLFAWAGGLAAALSLKAWAFHAGLLHRERNLSTLSLLSRQPSLKELPKLLADLAEAEITIGIFPGQEGELPEIVVSKRQEYIQDRELSDFLKALPLKIRGKDIPAILNRMAPKHIDGMDARWTCVSIPGSKGARGYYLVARISRKEFTGEELRRIKGFAEHTGLLLENRDLLKRLRRSDKTILQILLSTISQKSPSLFEHSQQVAELGKALAKKMKLDGAMADRIYKAGFLHDLGLIGLPDRILQKAEALNTEERAWVETHPSLAADMLETVPALSHIAPTVRHHHERFDGKGYPDGLAGNEIPLEARILAVSEACATIAGLPSVPGDQDSSNHSLKFEKALDEIKAHAGSQFDPEVVRALLEIQKFPSGGSNE